MHARPSLARHLVLSRCCIGVSVVLAIAWPASAQLQAVPYASGLASPLEFVQDPSSPSVQYVVEQGGRIRVIQGGVLRPTPFLDVSGVISAGGERGLLGLAFPPDYAVSRRFFVNFTNTNGDTVVARFKRSTLDPFAADPLSRFDLRWRGGQRFIAQPFANHNGGHLAFGPDGYLYVALGDGGSGDDPLDNAQNPATLLGKILRIDVNVSDNDLNGYVVPGDNPFLDNDPIAAFGEIWAFGLRNPWKFTFDDPALSGTGAMLIADVGQSSFEEVDYQPPGVGGRNYGWRVREGAHPHIASSPAYLPLVDPIAEYTHAFGVSITGGFVYRGANLPRSYRGRYFFGDFGSGRVWSIALLPAGGGEVTASGLIEHTAEFGGLSTIGNISAFGVDAAGEIYIVSYSAGRIWKIVSAVPSPQPPPVSNFDGDNRTDVAVWRPSTGAWSWIRSSDQIAAGQPWGAGFAPYNDVPVPGDYDGDGKTDVAVWRGSTGVWYVIQSSNGGSVARQWGMPGDRPVTGDYDGDGRSDLAVWHPSTGLWDISLSATGSSISQPFGAGSAPYNDIPVPADYDGDGITDIAVWRPSLGTWFIIRSSDGATVMTQWGAGVAPYNDVPVPGDYDGDGKTDVAVWRSADGAWYVIRSSDGSVVATAWGAGSPPYNDVPVPADYDGDGKTDVAVWRPAEGFWYIVRSSDGAIEGRQLGAAGDIPLSRSPR